MPRAATKEDLLVAAVAQYGKLGALLDSMDDEQLTVPFAFADRDRCVRDVLVHLHEWHNLLLSWEAANAAGDRAPSLPRPYTWRTYAGLNVEFRDRHQDTGLEEARLMLEDTHWRVLDLIRGYSNDDLFTKKRFPWTGSTSLGSYCVSATSSHYERAIKRLRAHIRSSAR